MTAQFLYFNTTSAECQNVTRDFRPPAESILVETVFTRYSAFEVCASVLGGGGHVYVCHL